MADKDDTLTTYELRVQAEEKLFAMKDYHKSLKQKQADLSMEIRETTSELSDMGKTAEGRTAKAKHLEALYQSSRDCKTERTENWHKVTEQQALLRQLKEQEAEEAKANQWTYLSPHVRYDKKYRMQTATLYADTLKQTPTGWRWMNGISYQEYINIFPNQNVVWDIQDLLDDFPELCRSCATQYASERLPSPPLNSIERPQCMFDIYCHSYSQMRHQIAEQAYQKEREARL